MEVSFSKRPREFDIDFSEKSKGNCSGKTAVNNSCNVSEEYSTAAESIVNIEKKKPSEIKKKKNIDNQICPKCMGGILGLFNLNEEKMIIMCSLTEVNLYKFLRRPFIFKKLFMFQVNMPTKKNGMNDC